MRPATRRANGIRAVYRNLGYYWPPDALRDNDNDGIEALKRAFASLGFEDRDNDDLEPGYQKVAVYAQRNDDWLHAAIQESNGEWSSKLGVSYDIRHKTPQCVEGPTYGKVVGFMKKKRIDESSDRGIAG